MVENERRGPILNLEQRHLEVLLEAGQAFNSSLDIDRVLNTVMDKVIEVMKAERGFLMLVDPDLSHMQTLVARNMDHSTINSMEFKISWNIVQKALKEKQPVLSSDAMDDPRFNSFQSVALHSIRSILCVPMVYRNRVIGVLYVDNRIQSGMFSEVDQELLRAIAAHAATAIENARLYEDSRNTVKALANAIEARDPYTKGHVERVGHLSVRIAKELGFSEDMVKDIETASILHDVGKIGVKDSVLSKPSELTPEERKLIEMHPPVGEGIVGPIGLSPQIKAAIRHHQEKFDGTGYPDKLKAEDIPLYARILAVADTYDAMTTTRPYRNALPKEVALDEIKKNAGKQFDPSIVRAFLRVMKKYDI